MNRFDFSGYVCKDAEQRVTQSGTTVTRFSLAVKRENNDEADFFECVTFGKQAEFAGKYIKKGKKLYVSGRIRKTKSNDKWYTDFIVNYIEFLNTKKEEEKQEEGKSEEGKPEEGKPEEAMEEFTEIETEEGLPF